MSPNTAGGASPRIWYWRAHPGGSSSIRATPIPCGSLPSTAALTRDGARKASERVILTCRLLHCSRAAMCCTLATTPDWISESHSRPRDGANELVESSAVHCRHKSSRPGLFYGGHHQQ